MKLSINSNVRNVVIILAVAAVVDLVPAGGSTARFVIQLVSLAFLAAAAWIAMRLYREHRVALYSLGDRRRAMLYGAVGVAALTLTAEGRLTSSGGGTVAFLLLLAGCVFVLVRVYQASRSY